MPSTRIARLPDRTKTHRAQEASQEQVHRRPRHPRRVRRRDRHPAPLHGRRRPTPPAPSPPRRSCCPRSASPSARSSRSTTQRWQAVGRPTTSPTTPTSRRSSRSSTASARPARRRSTSASATPRSTPTSSPRASSRAVRRDLHALHAPRLPGPLHRRPRSASSARATAASTTSRARCDGGPPVRPLDRFYTRVRNGQRRDRPALLGQPRARALLAARPGRAARRHRPVPVPVAPDHPEARPLPQD